MGALVAIIAIVATFGVPAYFFKRAMDYKLRKLELASSSNKQLSAHSEERQELVSRIEALEAIVHDGDYELNRQIKLVAKAEEHKRLASPDESAKS